MWACHGGNLFMRVRRQLFMLALLMPLAAASGGGFTASFDHGVASGDPHSDSIIIWTRATPQVPTNLIPWSSTLNVSWQVWPASGDKTSPVRHGSLATTAERDFTVKVLVSGLDSGVAYRFRFECGVAQSAVGRFRLPPPRGHRLEALHYAIFSCSSWSWGYFNAYAAAAADPQPLDFWLHVGDWMYEYGQDGHYPSPYEVSS